MDILLGEHLEGESVLMSGNGGGDFVVYLGDGVDTEITGLSDDVDYPAGSRHELLVEFLSQCEELDEGFLYGVCELLLHDREFPLVYLSGRFVDGIDQGQGVHLLVVLVGKNDVPGTYPQSLLLGQTVLGTVEDLSEVLVVRIDAAPILYYVEVLVSEELDGIDDGLVRTDIRIDVASLHHQFLPLLVEEYVVRSVFLDVALVENHRVLRGDVITQVGIPDFQSLILLHRLGIELYLGDGGDRPSHLVGHYQCPVIGGGVILLARHEGDVDRQRLRGYLVVQFNLIGVEPVYDEGVAVRTVIGGVDEGRRLREDIVLVEVEHKELVYELVVLVPVEDNLTRSGREEVIVAEIGVITVTVYVFQDIDGRVGIETDADLGKIDATFPISELLVPFEIQVVTAAVKKL